MWAVDVKIPDAPPKVLRRAPLLLLLCAVPALAERGELNTLTGDWKCQSGDDIRWAQPAFDDASWPTVHVPGSRLPVEQGPVWLRIRVLVDPQTTDLAVGTAALAEASEIYWNGTKLGGAGYFRESGKPDWDVMARAVALPVPRQTIPANGQVLIALRLSRPASNKDFERNLTESSLFVGNEGLVRDMATGPLSFPAVPPSSAMFNGMSGRTDVVIHANMLLFGLHMVMVARSAPELPVMMWFGINNLFFGAGMVVIMYCLEATFAGLFLWYRVFAVLMTIALSAYMEVFYQLAGFRSRLLRIAAYGLAGAGMLVNLAAPDLIPPVAAAALRWGQTDDITAVTVEYSGAAANRFAGVSHGA